MKAVDPRWVRIQALFSQAADLPTDERRRFLDQECGGDKELRAELDALLEFDHGPVASGHSGLRASVLTQALSLSVDSVQQSQRQQRVGSVVGAYRLISVLGHGGSGTVYLGERMDAQYDSQVAVKILSHTLHEELVYRFHAERQILANLNHPAIATLLDAGQLPDGQPYLVMEYIQGEAIDRYCDNHQLSIKERLALFMKVCDAVQYAHQHLIVHRDLKPGNILVTPKGEPKLLDFGIAKWLDKRQLPADTRPVTQMTDRLLTPEYASPEQILGKPITTTSDVYALGVLLYELLIGARPYVLTVGNQLELEHLICVIDPAPPSHTLMMHAADEATLPQVTAMLAARCMSLRRLRQTLKGDLDAIVMFALRKEADERYESVAQFMEDVDRYLKNAPVLARQGTWLYNGLRFLKRNGPLVALATAITLVLIFVASILVVQNLKVIAERDWAKEQIQRAEIVSTFMLDVFSTSSMHSRSATVTASELLDNAAELIQNDLNTDPIIRAKLMYSIGRSFQRQSRPSKAISILKKSLILIDQQPGFNAKKKAATLDFLGKSFRDAEELDSANEYFNEGLAYLEKKGLENSTEYLQLLIDKAGLSIQQGKITDGENFYRKAIALSRRLYGNKNSEVAFLLVNLGQTKLWSGNIDEGINLTNQAREIYKRTLPENHPDRINTDLTLAKLLSRKGKSKEANAIVTDALEKQKAVFGYENVRVAFAYEIASSISQQMTEWNKAEEYSRKALAISIKISGEDSLVTAFFSASIGELFLKTKRYYEAKSAIEKSLIIFKKSGKFSSQDYCWAKYLEAKLNYRTKKSNEAIHLLSLNTKCWKKINSAPWLIARSQNLLAELQWSMSHDKKSRALLLESWQVISAPNSGAPPDLITEARERTERILGPLPNSTHESDDAVNTDTQSVNTALQ